MDDAALVRVLKALADPTRFRMVQEIAAGMELNCGQVCERFSLAQPTISHHMKLLTDAGLLVVRKEGQRSIVSVNKELLDEVVGLLPRRLESGAKPSKAAKAKRSKAKKSR